MIYASKSRLSQHFLASPFQGGIMPRSILGLACFIENQYPLMHDQPFGGGM
jgi:hypothetical protein